MTATTTLRAQPVRAVMGPPLRPSCSTLAAPRLAAAAAVSTKSRNERTVQPACARSLAVKMDAANATPARLRGPAELTLRLASPLDTLLFTLSSPVAALAAVLEDMGATSKR